MSLYNSLNRAQSLIQELQACSLDENTLQIVSSLSNVILDIETGINKRDQNETSHQPPTIQAGCYIFPDEKGFFCPNCYDQVGNKVATTRINSKLRVCPACRTTIK